MLNRNHKSFRLIQLATACGVLATVASSTSWAQTEQGLSLSSESSNDMIDPLQQADVQLDLTTPVAEQDEAPFIPEQVIPEPEKPLVTIEDYQKRLAEIEAVALEMTEKAARVNNTAALWKEAHDTMQENNRNLTMELETVKARNRQLIIENGELRTKAERLRTVNLNNPIINITEEDLELKPERESMIVNRVEPPQQRRAQPLPPAPAPAARAQPLPVPAPPQASARPAEPARGTRVPVPENAARSVDPFPANAPNSADSNWVWDPETGTLHRVGS